MRMMTRIKTISITRRNLENKILAMLIVLYPIFSYYGYGFCSLAFCISVLWMSYFYKKRGVLHIMHPTSLIVYMLYFCFARVVCNDSISTIISPSIIFLFLFWGFLNREVCLEKYIKYYRIVVLINIAFLAIQELMFHILGYRIVGILDFLPSTISKGDFDVSEWSELAQLKERSSALFSEPAHFVQYLLPLVAVELFYVADKRAFIRCLVYLIVLLILSSGNALIGIIVLMLFFLVKILTRLKIVVAIPIILLIMLLFVFSINYVLTTEYGQKLYDRSEQIEAEQQRISSGFLRIYRGYYIMDAMSPTDKLFGLHSNEKIKDRIRKCPAAATFEQDDIYMNAVQSHLIVTGYIGTALFVIFLYYLWRGNNIAGRCCIVTYVCLSFVASIYWTHTMILFLLTSFLMKKENTSVKIKTIKIGKKL